MFKQFRFIMLSVAALGLLFMTGCEEDEPTAPGVNMAQVRVIHTSYDAPNVDVALDSDTVFTDLAYGESSGYSSVPIESGTRSLAVTPTGATSPVVISADLTLEATNIYTVFAFDSLENITAAVEQEDKSAVSGEAKIRFVHASPDAPAVDIRTGDSTGTAVFSDAAFKDIADYTTVSPGEYKFVVTPAGAMTEVTAFDPVELQAGQVYTVVAHGTLNENDDVPFGVRVFIDNGLGEQYVDLAPPTADVRFIHASYDAPDVDVYADDDTTFTELEYGASSGYTKIVEGTTNIVVTPTGESTANAVIDSDIDFVRFMDYTAFAMGEVANIIGIVETDDRAPVDDEVKVRFVHASPDAPAVDIKVGAPDSTLVFDNAAFQDVTAYTTVAEGNYGFVVTETGNTSAAVISFEEETLEAGNVYTVIAHGTLDDQDNYPFTVTVFMDNGAGSSAGDLTPVTP
ncbi:MAG: DUF4397 domain-containing protein [Candidatus Marinimicrobia bacterium]|nr:DUF4397 domain-containing protein [Candidatus Neomarinimicrobiota bacterium]